LSGKLNKIIENTGKYPKKMANDFEHYFLDQLEKVTFAMIVQEAASLHARAIIGFLRDMEKETAGDRRKEVRTMLKRIKGIPRTDLELTGLKSSLQKAFTTFHNRRFQKKRNSLN